MTDRVTVLQAVRKERVTVFDPREGLPGQVPYVEHVPQQFDSVRSYFTRWLVQGQADGTLAANLSTPAEGGATAALTATGSAVEGTHYSISPGLSQALSAGATAASWQVTPTAESRWFREKQLVLTSATTSGTRPGVKAETRFFIRTLNPPPSVDWVASTSSASASTTVTISLALSTASLEAASIPVVLVDRTTGDSLSASTIEIPAGSTAGSVDVTIGAATGRTLTVRLVLDAAARRNLYTFTEYNHDVENYWADQEVGNVDFPTDPTDNLYSGSNLESGWKLEPFEDPSITDETGAAAKGVAHYNSTTIVGKIRKSYSAGYTGGFPQTLPVTTAQTLCFDVARPTEPYRRAEFFSIVIFDRTDAVNHGADFRWESPPVIS